MSESDAHVPITLRIPGNWEHPGEMIERMPQGYRFTPEAMVMPDGTEIEFIPMPPDDQFAGIFRSSCRRPASDEEMEIVDGYTVNIGLNGPGGSKEAALATMQAGAAIIRAGGAGVFIDNCGLAHGGGDWIEMAEDGGPDALSFAFVNIIRGDQEIWTMGMHVLGLADVAMRRADLQGDDDGDTIIELIRYMAAGEKPIGHGHILADEAGPRFQALSAPGKRFDADSPMFNPFGRLKLVSMKDIAESN